MKRYLSALVIAFGLAGLAVVVLHASEGPYNTNPPFCRTHSPVNPLWWYYDCMYPDDPSWGQEQ